MYTYLKSDLVEVLNFEHIDSLLSSDWVVAQELIALLERFAEQTDILQTDSQSLSSVVPALLELQLHLQQFKSDKRASAQMLANLEARFAYILQPVHQDVNPLPAAACLLDPTAAFAILGFEHSELREAAKRWIIAEVCIVSHYYDYTIIFYK